MTVGRRQYNEAEMLQMQRDAEVRVREMQNRVRKTVENANHTGRGWHSPSGLPRQQQLQEEKPEPPPEPPVQHNEDTHMLQKKEQPQSTVVGDIMDALGIDEDYLLIIGLILILINQRADTTLILALAYLLV